MKKNSKIETICVQGGWEPKNGEPRVLPIYQSTTYKYSSAEEVAGLFDMTVEGHMYSRISNPTLEAYEKKLSMMEKSVACVLTSSGQSAIMLTVMNICNAGDHLICSSSLYGGTINLFCVTLKRYGIEVTMIDPEADEKEILAAVRPNTKLIYAETLSNPGMVMLDFEKFSKVAVKADIPLVIDNTFATPALCTPIDFGANIIIHSTTKYLDGHASSLGGAVIDCGNFNWNNGKFDSLCTPDESYHGVVYTEKFGNAAFAQKLRLQLIRDTGAIMSPFNAYLTNLGTETLPLRMERHGQNALRIAQFLEKHDMVEWVSYPGLKSSPYYERAQKYMPKGICGVMSFGIKGGKKAAMKFLDALELIAIVVHVADARSCVLHPASSTHRQLTDEQLKAAGIGAELIRLSVGIENCDDLIEDIQQALEAARV